ncbi:MAG: NAD(P)-dependent oxidoreductase [Rhodobacteraceae bacterium]|jgi:NAD(P)-dependent dehydrogenase (short-subunit alcohol dehydrogenase family)|uniref:Short-chain alcohol dehydrogenase n=1 Tax=Salipiger profundus TaxID=1229727 RepID=A0A1U7DAJ9_9RHOB|nr:MULTISPECIES: SDR family oxidoreductase [Salipiger]APX25138.1 short-chain alcohol dehydrogenase [Salipiger profundus]MAB05478.1 NAD(P)-dependent oxidoreductase [Paracoccaceae bacterium]GGA15581.1 3-oxoacyl-ACP reductase [Salipiger profundus]SFD09864.1 NADP-dependent 3-hydroxy acid dehydrogenase YdfG [Salipiger profundus]
MTQGIVITGAGSGIGRVTAQAFLEAGWRVALVGRREAPLVETANGDPNALVVPFDVSEPAAVDAGFAQVADRWSRIDALFNNAGIFSKAAMIDEIPVEDWLALASVNITGMVLCARAAFGQMRRQTPQGGRIINNGSISAHVPRWGSVPYTTSKHAITGLTKSLSLDGRAFDIACGQIDIGNALTDMAAPMAEGVPQASGEIAPEPVMDASHCAQTVLHMASLPLDANVQFVTVMATAMPYIGRG